MNKTAIIMIVVGSVIIGLLVMVGLFYQPAQVSEHEIVFKPTAVPTSFAPSKPAFCATVKTLMGDNLTTVENTIFFDQLVVTAPAIDLRNNLSVWYALYLHSPNKESGRLMAAIAQGAAVCGLVN